MVPMARRLSFDVLVVGLVMALPATTFAFRAGPLAGKNGSTASGGASCTDCHGSASGSGSVALLGAPTEYAINTVYDLTVRIADPVQDGAGFQISVEDAAGGHRGTLIVTDVVNTQFNPADAHWVNHTAAGVDDAVANWAGMGNAAEYHLQWQAPSYDAGELTFWVAGNAIDNNFSSSGDFIYLTSQTADLDLASIPTVSQWGLAALTIAVLSAGTVVVRRRATATAVA